MSALSDKQWQFVVMTANFIAFAASIPGVKLTYGDAYRDPRVPYGEKRSAHRQRLAVDWNLRVNDVLIETDHPVWHRLGEYWKSIGGTWGGDFVTKNPGDYGHFSLEHDGIK